MDLNFAYLLVFEDSDDHIRPEVQKQEFEYERVEDSYEFFPT